VVVAVVAVLGEQQFEAQETAHPLGERLLEGYGFRSLRHARPGSE
jgi:hypothetical protein